MQIMGTVKSKNEHGDILLYAAMPSVNMVADLISNQTYHRKV